MPLQRVCDAEKQARNTGSNGPRRVQGTENPEYSATRWDASVPGDMLVSCKAASRVAYTQLRLR